MRQVSCADLCSTEGSSYRPLILEGHVRTPYDSMDGVGVASVYGILSEGRRKLRA